WRKEETQLRARGPAIGPSLPPSLKVLPNKRKLSCHFEFSVWGGTPPFLLNYNYVLLIQAIFKFAADTRKMLLN
ncbi:MAG: hypothetical protein WBZ05_18415, partial [Desulfobacterales bacterium]